MTEATLEHLLGRYYPQYPAQRFPGADQHRYANLVRKAIRDRRRLEEAAGGKRTADTVHVLDFGCGRGATSLYDFRDPGVHVRGVDPDAAVFKNPYIDEASICDDRLPVADESIDIVCSSYVLEHIDRPERTLAEIHRVLKRGGKFIALTPNAGSLVATFAKLTPHRFHVWLNRRRGCEARDVFPTYYRLNRAGVVRRRARGAGFTDAKIDYWEGRPEYLYFSRFTFFAGVAWERLVNTVPLLAGLRSSLFIVLTK